MRSRLARFIVFVAAVQILGGHWLALQSIAWIGMLAQYPRAEASIVVAIGKTFDGEHPCGLCQAVKKGLEEEQRQELVKTVVKLEAVLRPASPMPQPRSRPWRYLAAVPEPAPWRPLAPPTPPPLAA